MVQMESSGETSSALPPDAFDDRSGLVIGIVVAGLLWSTFMVGLRIFTRARINKELGIDDIACVFGLLVTCGSGIAILHMTRNGLGKHIYGIEPSTIPALVPAYLRSFYVSIVLYCAALMAIKLCFLFGYYRVLGVQHMRMVYIVAIVIVGGWSLSQVFVGIFICTPVQGFWDTTIESKCIPNIPQWYINAAGNIITDVAVFLLPLPAIWGLTLAKRQKALLMGIFCLGFFTVIISIVRIRYLKMFEDFTWENVAPACWSIVELTSAITCSCLSTLRPFVTRYFPNLAIFTGRSSKGYAQTDESGVSGAPTTIGSKSIRQNRGLDYSGGRHADDSQIELGVGRKTSNNYEPSIGRGSNSAESLGREQIVALNPTTRTNIQPSPPGDVHPAGGIHPAGVTVQRDVYLTSSQR